MTAEKVLKNLEQLIGEEFDSVDVMCAFEDFEEDGETQIIVKESENDGYDMIAYINSINSTQFLFTIEENKISDVWMVKGDL